MTIKILNPVPGGATHVGWNRAQRYIKAGRATISNGQLIFHLEHHGHQAALRAAESHHTRGGYDRSARSGMAQLDQMANIPIINPREMFAPSGKLIPRSPRMKQRIVYASKFKEKG